MHIHIHVSKLVCCYAAAAWVVVKTEQSSGSDRHNPGSLNLAAADDAAAHGEEAVYF